VAVFAQLLVRLLAERTPDAVELVNALRDENAALKLALYESVQTIARLSGSAGGSSGPVAGDAAAGGGGGAGAGGDEDDYEDE
jgi:hypothetical protein